MLVGWVYLQVLTAFVYPLKESSLGYVQIGNSTELKVNWQIGGWRVKALQAHWQNLGI